VWALVRVKPEVAAILIPPARLSIGPSHFGCSGKTSSSKVPARLGSWGEDHLSSVALVSVVKSSDLRNHYDPPVFRLFNYSRLRGVLG
jgi:hypothetical protein